MSGLWKTVRPHLAQWKKSLFNRPYGLKRLGDGAYVIRPWRFEGRPYIEIGSRTCILGGANICAIAHYENYAYTPSISIGDDVYIGPNIFLACASSVKIGDGAVLSEHVFIADVSHGFSPEDGPIMKQPLVVGGPVVIGENSFIGFRASVMPGVLIGRNCIVGANSVVTKSIPDYCLAVGNPAEIVKRYDPFLKDWQRIHRDDLQSNRY